MATVAAKNVAVTSTSPKTSASVSVAASDVLVVFGYGQDGTTLNNPTNTGTAVSAWTLQKFVTPGSTWTTQYVWTAPVTASDGAVTVSVSRKASGSPSSAYGFTVLKVTGASTIGASVADLGTGVPSLSLTTGANSVIVYGAGDWNPATGSASWLSINGSTGVQDLDTTPGDRFYVRHWLDSGAAGTKTVGMSAPSGQKWVAVALELRALQNVESDFTFRSDSRQTVESDFQFRADSKNLNVETDFTFRAGSLQNAEADFQFSASSQWLGTWRELITTQTWADAVTARERTITARAELVDQQGNPVQDLRFDTASVDFRGEQAEVWAGSITFTDPDMVPTRPEHPLDPRAGLRVRLWWRILEQGQWLEVPVGTMIMDDPAIDDDGTSLGISATLRDTLTVARRTGYGAEVVKVGGLTVDDALRRLFASVAPWAQVSFPASTVVLPDTYQLGIDHNDPGADWTELAELAGWRITTDRMGVVVAGPVADPALPKADWQEGPGCKVSKASRSITNSNIKNRILVRSTNTEAVGVYAVAEDTDPGSPTWVGRFGPFTMVIESDAIKTTEAAMNMARMQLAAHVHPTETVTVTAAQRGDLDYRDLIQLAHARAGAVGSYRVSGWNLRLGPANASPSPMTVTMMSRSLE